MVVVSGYGVIISVSRFYVVVASSGYVVLSVLAVGGVREVKCWCVRVD